MLFTHALYTNVMCGHSTQVWICIVKQWVVREFLACDALGVKKRPPHFFFYLDSNWYQNNLMQKVLFLRTKNWTKAYLTSYLWRFGAQINLFQGNSFSFSWKSISKLMQDFRLRSIKYLMKGFKPQHPGSKSSIQRYMKQY